MVLCYRLAPNWLFMNILFGVHFLYWWVFLTSIGIGIVVWSEIIPIVSNNRLLHFDECGFAWRCYMYRERRLTCRRLSVLLLLEFIWFTQFCLIFLICVFLIVLWNSKIDKLLLSEYVWLQLCFWITIIEIVLFTCMSIFVTNKLVSESKFRRGLENKSKTLTIVGILYVILTKNNSIKWNNKTTELLIGKF